MGATDPLPSCSAPHDALCRMASPVESRWTETAADREPPATRLKKSDSAMSPTAARPERLRGVQRHVVAVKRPTGPSLTPCGEPSIQGYDSLVVLILEHRRTPEGVGREAGPRALVQNLVHRTPHHTKSSETDTPGCFAVTVERQRNANDPDECQTEATL